MNDQQEGANAQSSCENMEHQHCPFPAIGRVLTHLSLALMIGGILALGAFVAPLVFKSGMARHQAAQLMTDLFTRYDKVLLASTLFLAMGECLQFKTLKQMGKKALLTTRYVLAGLLISSMICSIFVLHPQLKRYQQSGASRYTGQESQRFDQLHKTSESMYKLDLGVAVGLLVIACL